MPSQQTIYRAFPLLLMTIALMNIQSSVVAQPADSCVFDPTRDHCISFQLPENQAETMLADVCANDPRKPACSLKRVCDADARSGALVCAGSFALLAAACADASAASRGCATFGALCRRASLVAACRRAPPEDALPPSAAAAAALVARACAAAWDAALCAECADDSRGDSRGDKCRDPLLTLHTLCSSRKRAAHPACANVHSLCEYSRFPLAGLSCPDDPSALTLTPFLHSAFDKDHVLFEWAVPSNSFHDILAIAFGVLVGLIYEFLVNLRVGWEVSWKAELEAVIEQPEEEVIPNTNGTAETGGDNTLRIPLLQRVQRSVSQRLRFYSIIIKRQVRVRSLRSIVKALEGISLVSLVLLVATFNVNMCLSVVFGLAVGAFLFAL